MDVKKRLGDLRNEKGYSAYKLAKLSGVSPSYIQRIENGERNPTVDKLEKICKGLGISLADFFKADDFITTVDYMELVNHAKKLTNEQIKALNVILKELDK